MSGQLLSQIGHWYDDRPLRGFLTGYNARDAVPLGGDAARGPDARLSGLKERRSRP
jgi:hypothetical protein